MGDSGRGERRLERKWMTVEEEEGGGRKKGVSRTVGMEGRRRERRKMDKEEGRGRDEMGGRSEYGVAGERNTRR